MRFLQDSRCIGPKSSPHSSIPNFLGFSGFPVDPLNYRIPEPSPYVKTYEGHVFAAPDFETGHFEMARTNLPQNIDDKVVEVLGHRTMTMALENAEKSVNDGSFINKSIKEVNRLENYFGKK